MTLINLGYYFVNRFDVSQERLVLVERLDFIEDGHQGPMGESK
jgi:hypothetical protein